MDKCPYHKENIQHNDGIDNIDIVEVADKEMFFSTLIRITNEILDIFDENSIDDILAHPRLQDSLNRYYLLDKGNGVKYYRLFGKGLKLFIIDYCKKFHGIPIQKNNQYSIGGFSAYIQKMLHVAFHQFLYIKISSHEYGFNLKRKTYQLMKMHDESVRRVLGKSMHHENKLSQDKYPQNYYQKQSCPFLDFPTDVKEDLMKRMNDTFENWYQEMLKNGIEFKFNSAEKEEIQDPRKMEDFLTSIDALDGPGKPPESKETLYIDLIAKGIMKIRDDGTYTINKKRLDEKYPEGI